MLNSDVDNYNEQFKNNSVDEILNYFINIKKYSIKFSSSFGLEDQVITDMLNNYHKNIKIFTLDTARLHNQTYELMSKTIKRYNLDLDVYFPISYDIENLYKKQGVNGFYDSIQNRKDCCYVRKIKPLKKALNGVNIWITGLRAQQSVTRANMKMFEYDEAFNLIKFNPLIYYSIEDIWSYIKKNNVPYNSLHDDGYISIGCEPCTRKTSNDDIRSGRWWWESPEHKECGLHTRKNYDK